MIRCMLSPQSWRELTESSLPRRRVRASLFSGRKLGDA